MSAGLGRCLSVTITWQRPWCHGDGPVVSDSLPESPGASMMRDGWEGGTQKRVGAEHPER